jgi:mercuric ion transport protein
VVPLLVVAGVLSGAGWALLGQILPGIAVGLAALAGFAWWWARRRPALVAGCAGPDCGCAR